MSGVSRDWLFIGVFFGAFAAVTIGEIYWLTQRLSTPLKKSLTTVFLSNFITITLGFFVSFIIFGFILASTGEANAGMGGTGTRTAFVAALGFPMLLMAAVKRLLIAGLRMAEVSRPIPYAIVSTLIFFAAVFGLPAILLALR